MGTNGKVLGLTNIVNAGPASARWNVVLVSEGYREIEIPLFVGDAQQFAITLLANAPFDRLRAAINIYRVDVASTESGARDPTSCLGGSGAKPKTFFDATFCTSGLRRLLTVNNGRVHDVVHNLLPQAHLILVAVNSTLAGGSGGNPGVFSRAAGSVETALHEMGHSAFGLADEYQYYQNCQEKNHETHSGGEPGYPNVTTQTDPAKLKWRNLIKPGTPIPTVTNPDPKTCDFRLSPVPSGTIGLFDGADHYHSRAYRAEYDCRMRNVGQPFCGVCQEAIVKKLTPFLPPS
jgi:hypothetical protein